MLTGQWPSSPCPSRTPSSTPPLWLHPTHGARDGRTRALRRTWTSAPDANDRLGENRGPSPGNTAASWPPACPPVRLSACGTDPQRLWCHGPSSGGGVPHCQGALQQPPTHRPLTATAEFQGCPRLSAWKPSRKNLLLRTLHTGAVVRCSGGIAVTIQFRPTLPGAGPAPDRYGVSGGGCGASSLLRDQHHQQHSGLEIPATAFLATLCVM